MGGSLTVIVGSRPVAGRPRFFGVTDIDIAYSVSHKRRTEARAATLATALNRNGSDKDHVMAYAPSITPARRNPTWVPATEPLGLLAPFFNGRGAAPIINQPAPKSPAPARELVAC